jgi:hypothetical protein
MRVSEIKDALTSAVLWLLGLSSVVAGIIRGIEDHTSASVTLFGGGILLLLVANLGKLESFKGLGIEAKTREIKERIEEADKILGSLRDFLHTTATFTLQSIARQGRWDSHIPPNEAFPIVKSFEEQLGRMGFDRSRIDEIVEPWYEVTARDMLQEGLNQVSAFLRQKIEAEQKALTALPFPPGSDEERREREAHTRAAQGLDETVQRLTATVRMKAAAIPDAIGAELRTNTVLSGHEKAQLQAMMAASVQQAKALLSTKALPVLPS